MKVLNKIFEKDKDGNYIRSNEIHRLLAEKESISTYEQMMWQFWKKPSSFYKEFLENIEKKKEKLM